MRNREKGEGEGERAERSTRPDEEGVSPALARRIRAGGLDLQSGS